MMRKYFPVSLAEARPLAEGNPVADFPTGIHRICEPLDVRPRDLFAKVIDWVPGRSRVAAHKILLQRCPEGE